MAKKRRKKKTVRLGPTGTTVYGFTKDGQRWSAVVGTTGRLVNKIIDEPRSKYGRGVARFFR